MRAIAKKFRVAAILVAVPLFVSGCICGPECWWDDHPQPRRATFHVYVYDYYSYSPLSWAVVELYEESWWDWDYLGAWPVNRAGYAAAHAGYLYHDGCGGCEERDFRVVVGASGYCTEWINIELDFWHPSETLYFYLVPCCDRDGGSAGGGDGESTEPPLDERPPDRVLVGEPKEVPNEPGD